jgi:phosphoribosylformimino-5-aminoimidazole carboxamide ribotide isomerase
MLLIPSIDLRGGRCVRLLKGDFAAETRYEFDPLELLQRYRTLGAPWLHIVDLDGARDGLLANRGVIATLAQQPGIRLQVGGGVRSRAIIDELLQLGVARVAIGSAAIEHSSEVAQWLRDYGAEAVCLALDVKFDATGVPRLHTRGWRNATPLSLWEGVERYAECGLRHVLCTDIDRDGALAGPNAALYAQAARRYPGIRWQASGGVASIADLRALMASGAAAAVSGKALLEDRLPLPELQPFLRDA